MLANGSYFNRTLWCFSGLTQEVLDFSKGWLLERVLQHRLSNNIPDYGIDGIAENLLRQVLCYQFQY